MTENNRREAADCPHPLLGRGTTPETLYFAYSAQDIHLNERKIPQRSDRKKCKEAVEG
jgi:hypothetical protein